jgi:Phage P22-like portal protein
MPRVDSAMTKIAPRFSSQDGRGNLALSAYPMDATAKEKLLGRIRKNMERAISAESDNRKAGLDDRMFKIGQQWPTEIMAQRNLDKRPCLTVNKLPTFVHQIVNDQRQNRPSININPNGDRGDPEVAKMYRGLIRFIERDCAADIAYDTAFDDAVTMGWGYWRITLEWEAPDSFNCVLVIRQVRNPFSVYLDPAHVDPTGADAKWAFVTQMISRGEFTEKYPGATEMPYSDGGIGDRVNLWATKDEIRIAEYYEIEYNARTLIKLSNGHVGWEDDLDDITKGYLKRGKLQKIEERDSQVPTVMWYKVTAVDVLKEEEWIGTSIPIVKVVGDATDIEGKLKLSGIIRHAKDPQRMYNYWVTAETEMIALQPKAPWVMEEGQGEGHEDDFKNSNVKNIPVLYYKGTSVGGTMAPPPQRQPMAGIPSGIVTAKQGSAQDLMGVTGVRFDATMNERMIDESGKAIRELRRSGDLGAFHYVDNLARSLRRTGEILVEAIPLVYDEARVVTILREDDKEEQVKIDPSLQRPSGEEKRPDGKVRKLFNPTYGKYGVTVTIGPSYATKRIEASENMMAFMKALPQTAALVCDLFAAAQDWPGAEQIAARLAKTIPPQLMSPDIKDVPPQIQAIISSQEQSLKQLTQQLQAAMAQLQDKSADRQLEATKVQNDFEARLLKIIADTEAKTAATNQRSHDNANTHLVAQAKEFGAAATEAMHLIDKAEGEGAQANPDGERPDLGQGSAPRQDQPAATQPDTIPDEARQHLRAGRVTRFANGSRWTVGEDGQPRKVM